jgi:hypothetical protein
MDKSRNLWKEEEASWASGTTVVTEEGEEFLESDEMSLAMRGAIFRPAEEEEEEEGGGLISSDSERAEGGQGSGQGGEELSWAGTADSSSQDDRSKASLERKSGAESE